MNYMQRKKEVENLSDEMKLLIKKNYFPANASVADMQFCMGIAKTFDLNPMRNEIYFVERRSKVNGQWVNKVVPMIGRDGFLSIAHKTGKFEGMKTEALVKEVPVLINGVWETKKDLVGICSVYRKNSSHPFTVEVTYGEYVQRNRDGSPTSMWATKPITMMKKVAESQALRKAFSVAGLYSEEEIEISEVVTSTKDIEEDNIEKLMAKKAKQDEDIKDVKDIEIEEDIVIEGNQENETEEDNVPDIDEVLQDESK